MSDHRHHEPRQRQETAKHPNPETEQLPDDNPGTEQRPDSPVANPESADTGEDGDDDGSDRWRDRSQQNENDVGQADENESPGRDRDLGDESPERRRSVDPEEFDGKSFLSSVSDLHARLQQESYNNIDESFPADQIQDMVDEVTSTMDNFKRYAIHTQQELEKVRGQMKDIKTKIYKRIQGKGYDPKSGKSRRGGVYGQSSLY